MTIAWILGHPHREHAIVAVQMPAANVFESVSGESVASGHAAAIQQLLQGAASCRSTTPTEGAELPLRDSG